MRLSDDKARRLTRLVWRDRARRALPLVAIAVVLLAAVAYFTELSVDRIDRTVGVQAHSGTVVSVKPGPAARGTRRVGAPRRRTRCRGLQRQPPHTASGRARGRKRGAPCLGPLDLRDRSARRLTPQTAPRHFCLTRHVSQNQYVHGAFLSCCALR